MRTVRALQEDEEPEDEVYTPKQDEDQSSAKPKLVQAKSIEKSPPPADFPGGGGQNPNDAVFSIAKMAELLEFGTDSQRTVILLELLQLVEHCLDDTVRILIPTLCKHVSKWEEDIQIAATEALLEILQKDIGAESCKLICDAGFEVLKETYLEDILEAWGEILVVALPQVKDMSPEDVANISSSLGKFSVHENEVWRKLAARVYGSFASALTTPQVEKHVLQKSLSLANDEDLEVRGMLAESLAFIGERASLDVAERQVWPQMLRLLGDEDARIHAATLRSLAHILEAHCKQNACSKVYSSLFAPVFAKECAFVREASALDQRTVDDDTYLLLEIVSEVFGQFVFAVAAFLTSDAERQEIFAAFQSMSTCNGPIVRRNCAFNLPGVAQSMGQRYADEVARIVEFLSRDSDSETRWNLAAGIHESCRLLASDASMHSLFTAVTCLLQDDNPLVRTNTLEHFFSILESLTKHLESSKADELAPVFQNLTILSEGNWRTQELLAQQLDLVCPLVPHDALERNILPLLYQMSEESTYLVRKAAMPAIAKAIWCIRSPADRHSASQAFRTTWAEGGVFWMRTAFVDCGISASKLYSGQLFRSTFAKGLLRLADDPVSNVRLRLATSIHHMAFACDGMLEFDHALDTLIKDTDEDVKAVMDCYVTSKGDLGDQAKLKAEDDRRKEKESTMTAERAANPCQRTSFERKQKSVGKHLLHPSVLTDLKSIKADMDVVDLEEPSPTSVQEASESLVSIASGSARGSKYENVHRTNSKQESGPMKKRSSISRLALGGHSDGSDGISSPRAALQKVRQSLTLTTQSSMSTDEEEPGSPSSGSRRSGLMRLSIGKKLSRK